MSDYICPQCGQTYDALGVCDVCGIDLQPNDAEMRDENEEEGFNEDESDTFDDSEDGDEGMYGGDDSDEDDYDDE